RIERFMKKSADAEYDFLDFWEANQKFFAMKQGTTENLMHFKERFLTTTRIPTVFFVMKRCSAGFRDFIARCTIGQSTDRKCLGARRPLAAQYSINSGSVNDGVSTPRTDAACAAWRKTTYTSPAALPPGPRPSGSSYSKNSKIGSSPPPLLHPSPNSLGPFFAPSAPLTTSLKLRLRGTAYTECLLPPSPKSVRLNSALAPNVSSKAFSSTAGPTPSNNSLAVVADPVTAGLPIYLDSSSLSVKACGSIVMMSFILTTTSSTNSTRLLSIDASTKSLTWVLATYLGTFALPSVDPAL
ncbi:unnamed protein product, partial [Cylindrotheca closterium]